MERAKRSLGRWSLFASVLAVVGVAVIALATFTSAGSALEPPNWLRAVFMPLFPVGIIASVALGIAALGRDAGRRSALVGLSLSALSVVAFAVTIFSVDY